MARGYPDYSKSVGTTIEGKFLQQLADPPIWWHDNFDEPVNKWRSDIGTLSLFTEHSYEGHTYKPYRFGGMAFVESALGLFGSMFHYIGTFPLTYHLGFSCMFSISEQANWKDIENSLLLFWINYYTTSIMAAPYVSYNPRTGKWYYSADEGTTFVEMGTFLISTLFWHYAKLIIDPISKKYISFQIDSKVYDISTASYYTTADNANAYAVVNITTMADAGDKVGLHIDDYKVTYNES